MILLLRPDAIGLVDGGNIRGAQEEIVCALLVDNGQFSEEFTDE